MVSSITTLLALASAAAALQVTSPTSDSVWTVGDSQTVTWDSVDSDQSTFDIYLSNMVEYPSVTVLLASDISSSDGSATIDGSKLTAGNSFTINFTNGTKTEQIYAQSNQFNITASSSSSSSSSASSSASTGTASASSGTTTPSSSTLAGASSSSSSLASAAATTGANSVNGTGSSTATATGTAASGSSTASATGSSTGTATGSSSTSSSTSTSGAEKILAGWMGVIAVAALAL